jgi:hypothetical protein
VHLDKLDKFGGPSKVFDPETNITIGAIILADCIKLNGTIELGLKCYVGATGPTDNGYGLKVLAEKERIEKAKFGVFDFAPNNKVLIDLGLASPIVDINSLGTSNFNEGNSPRNAAYPASNSAPNQYPLNTLGTSMQGAMPNTNTLPSLGGLSTSTTPPLIPKSVTALPVLPFVPSLPQAPAPVLQGNTVGQSASGLIKPERELPTLQKPLAQ